MKKVPKMAAGVTWQRKTARVPVLAILSTWRQRMNALPVGVSVIPTVTIAVGKHSVSVVSVKDQVAVLVLARLFAWMTSRATTQRQNVVVVEASGGPGS